MVETAFQAPGVNRCAVSGLPVYASAEWTDLAIGSDYRATFTLIGGHILLVRMAGRVVTADVDLLFSLRKRFLEESGASGRRIVEIRDYGAITGEPAREARAIQARYLLACKDQLACFMVANAPWRIRTTFRIGLQLFKPPCPFEIIADTNTAIRRAVHLLAVDEGVDMYPLEKLVRLEGWSGTSGSFTWELAVAPRLFVYTRVAGYLDEKEFDRLYALYSRVFDEGIIGIEPFFRIIDISALEGMSWRMRMKYPARLNEIHRKHHIFPISTYFYGAKGMVKPIISMIAPFVPYDVLPTAGYTEAVRKILVHQKKVNPRAKSIDRIGDAVDEKNPETLRKRELLRYIGTLSWDTPEVEPPVDPDHPYAEIYEALSLVKVDIQRLLAEEKAGNNRPGGDAAV